MEQAVFQDGRVSFLYLDSSDQFKYIYIDAAPLILEEVISPLEQGI